MYILTEKENNNLNFYSESGDGVKLFEDLDSLRATVETLQDAERELFGDLKTEFGYIEFNEGDINTLSDEVYVQNHKLYIKLPMSYKDNMKFYMDEFSKAMELLLDEKAGIKKPVYFDENENCVCCMDFGKLPDDAVMTIAETFFETLEKLHEE